LKSVYNLIQNIKKLERCRDSFSFEGKILSGIRSFLTNDGSNIEDIVPNGIGASKVVKYAASSGCKNIFVASTNRYAIKEDKVFCNSGGSKFYHPLDDEKGLYVFASMHNGRMDRSDSFIKDYVKTALCYKEKGIFPTLYRWTYVDLDLEVIKTHSNNKLVRLKGKAFALITRRIFAPNYILDTSNDNHLKFLKKVWKDKTIYPTLLKKEKFIDIFGRKFFVENPKFRLDKQKRFCRIIRKAYLSTDSHLRLRNKIKGKVRKLDNKYGNVLYCCKEKKWYFVDLD